MRYIAQHLIKGLSLIGSMLDLSLFAMGMFVKDVSVERRGRYL